MARYLISFDDGAMTFPEEDLPAVAEAAHSVVREAQDAGIWVFGGGLHSYEEASVVGTDGTVTDGPERKAYIGGFSVIDIPSHEEALEWARRIAVACRCAQEIRELRPRLYALIKAIPAETSGGLLEHGVGAGQRPHVARSHRLAALGAGEVRLDGRAAGLVLEHDRLCRRRRGACPTASVRRAPDRGRAPSPSGRTRAGRGAPGRARRVRIPCATSLLGGR